MEFEPDIWGPHFWFFLHNIAEAYPLTSNKVTKRKYYDLIQNLPLFIPHDNMGNQFSHLIDKYPVSPYLDTRESFTRWVHFIHNKINYILDKKRILLPDALKKYRDLYKNKTVHLAERFHIKKHFVISFFIIILFIFIYLTYN